MIIFQRFINARLIGLALLLGSGCNTPNEHAVNNVGYYQNSNSYFHEIASPRAKDVAYFSPTHTTIYECNGPKGERETTYSRLGRQVSLETRGQNGQVESGKIQFNALPSFEFTTEDLNPVNRLFVWGFHEGVKRATSACPLKNSK